MQYLMAGPGGAYQPAGSCPVAEAIMGTDYAAHHGVPSEPDSFMVADMMTKDGSASIRVALWRCQYCNTLLIGVARAGVPVDGPPGTGVSVQEFTWLEETIPVLGDHRG